MSQIYPETFQTKTYRVNDSDEITSLTRFRLSFIHFHKHRFRQNFKDMLNPLCSFSIEAETTNYYFLRYLFYNENRKIIINVLEIIEKTLSFLPYCIKHFSQT